MYYDCMIVYEIINQTGFCQVQRRHSIEQYSLSYYIEELLQKIGVLLIVFLMVVFLNKTFSLAWTICLFCF